MVEEVRKKVYELLSTDNSGHGAEHVEQVTRLAKKFTEEEHADVEVSMLIALLHDADDIKLFGAENAKNLTNTRRILAECGASDELIATVCSAMGTIGFGKRLSGIVPNMLEAKIVSDADMCDALGTAGIVRSQQYSIAKGRKFFDRNIFPATDITAEDYYYKSGATSVNHMFEKCLKLKDLMLTDAGKKEAATRHNIVVDFLYHFFDEVDAPEWTEYLNNYLGKQQ